MDKGEIVLYQPDDTVLVEVRLENETVWLTRAQIAELFGIETPAISKHINNIYKAGELDKASTVSILETVQQEGTRTVKRQIAYYNLDMILSVGYRVNSINATQFRRWANQVLKDFVLRGYAVNQRIERLENRVTETEKKIDFFVKTSLPPVQGIFYDGQIFDAYVFASDLIKLAWSAIVLFDNYIDESVLLLLSKRQPDVSAQIYTREIPPQLKLDITKHNSQYEPISVGTTGSFHDRFLVVDNTVYHIGASLKDLGKRLFAFSKM